MALSASWSVTSSEMMVASPLWLSSKALRQTVFAPRHLASLETEADRRGHRGTSVKE